MKGILMGILTTLAALFSRPSQAAQPATNIDPQKLLFSVSTINDALPNRFTENVPSKATVVIHEDNWRQCEFISSKQRKLIDDELRDIDEIWKSQSVKVGEFTAFRKVHIRKRIITPINIHFSEFDFATLVGQKITSFTFRDYPHTLQDVVATRSGGFIFYASIAGGNTDTFGIDREAAPNLNADTAGRLQQFMKNNGLLLVHWPSRTLFESPTAVANYLTGKKN